MKTLCRIFRDTFIKILLLAMCATAAAADGEKPKNIIFILLDDLRFDGMGFLQSELETPNIDALAREGAYFPDAVVTTSICSPSRATILTGQTTRNHRIVDNNNSSEEGLVYFPKYLQEAGYETSFFGKWHMGNDSDDPRPGFDKWVSFEGQGTYGPTDGIPPEKVKQGVRQVLNVDGKHVKRTDYMTDELHKYAMDWLKEDRNTDKPFFLYLSHKAVHSDAVPAERHIGQYDDTEFDLPETRKVTDEYRDGKPMWVQNQRNSWHGIDFFYHKDLSMNDYLKDYYGALSSVDDSVGEILQYLRENDLEDDTMVVFYSDNGFMIGDHGLIDKRAAYEASVRVPLVIYSPGAVPAGKTIPGLVRNLDIAPTFLDVAGVNLPEQFEGKSFLPLATGELSAQEWGEPDFVYEYYWEWTFPMTPTTFAIQRGPYKYIQYHGIWDIEELYNVEKDPNETTNLIEDLDYREKVIELRAALYASLENNQGDHEVPYSERLSKGSVRRGTDGPKAASFPKGWLVEPNRKDRFINLIPDTPAKLEAERKGEVYNHLDQE